VPGRINDCDVEKATGANVKYILAYHIELNLFSIESGDGMTGGSKPYFQMVRILYRI
jgi:hypothetical protein